MNLPTVGVQAVIQGLPAFNAAAIGVQNKLNAINVATNTLAMNSGSNWRAIGAISLGTLGAIATAAGLTATAIAAIAPVVGKFAADYETKLTRVQVFSESTAREIAELNDTIYKLGTTSSSSMLEVADGASELAKAGIDVKDQIGGALKAVVDFTAASAGDLGMAEAAMTVAKGLTIFGLEGKDASQVTDSLTAAAQKTNLSYKDLTRSFQQAALLSSQLGFSIQDLSAILGVMGDAGLRGSDAGTSLKQMFIELLDPSKEAAELMNKYHISLFDVTGATRPLRDLILDLENAFGDQAVATGKLTEQQRANALAVIFGSDAIRASIVSAKFGVKAFDEMTATIERTKATDIANLFMLPLNAQLDLLANKLIGAATVLGGVFLDSVRNSVTDLNVFLSKISSRDIQVFGLMMFIMAQGALESAKSLYELGQRAASTVQPLFNSTAGVTALTVALGALAAPTLITSLTLLTGTLVRLGVGIGIAYTALATFVSGIAGGSIFASLFALSTAIGGVGLAFTGFGAILVALTTNIGGFRDSVVRIFGFVTISIIGTVRDWTETLMKFAGSVLQVAGIIVSAFSWITENLWGTSTVVTNVLDKLSDDLTQAGYDTKQYAEDWGNSSRDSQQAVFDLANSWIEAAPIADRFGKSLSDLRYEALALAAAFDDPSNDPSVRLGAGQRSLPTGGGQLPNTIQSQMDKINALTNALSGAKGGLASSLAGPTESSASGAAKKAETFLEALGVTVDQVRKLFDELGYSTGESTKFMQLLGISAAEASPLLGSLGLTMEQGVQILVKLGFTVEEATEKITALQVKLTEVKSAFEETGASIDGARKLLESLGFSTDDAVSSLAGLGVDALDASGGLHEIGLNAEQATKVLVALGFGTDEAREKLKQLADGQLAKEAAEKAKQEFEKFRGEILATASAITSALMPAIGLVAGGGLADNQVTATRAIGTQLTGSLLGELAQIGEFSPELVHTIAILLTDLTTTATMWNEVSATAATSTDAFFAALAALPLVATDTSNAIGAMQNSAGALEALLPKLTGQEREFAEATIKAWNALINQAIAAGDDEKKLEAVRKAAELMKPAFDKVSSSVDTAVLKFDAMRASVSKLGFAMEDIMDAANDAARTFATQMEFTAKIAEDAARRAALAPFLADVQRAAIEEKMKAGGKDSVARKEAITLRETGVRSILDLVERAKKLSQFNEDEFTREDLLKEILSFNGGSNVDLVTMLTGNVSAGLRSSTRGLADALLDVSAEASAELGVTRSELLALAQKLWALRVLEGSGDVQSFHQGGQVPGAPGEQVLARLMAGEYVMTPTQVQSIETTMPRNFMAQMMAAMKNQGNTSYVVNASYGNQQSPASIGMDLRAMVAQTR